MSRALQPLHVAPEAPVFENTCGLPIGAEQLEAGGVQFPKSARRCDAQRVRKGGLEPEAALEMIEVFHGECCAVWRLVA